MAVVLDKHPRVGDRVSYSPFGGGLRTVLVTTWEADIKNGRSGFDGKIIIDGVVTDQEVWGYDDQITHMSRG